ncbi:MAG: BTAD domain-containing putative transcriptional regulator, partial [Gaiella sp.]
MTTRISILGDVAASTSRGPVDVGSQQQRALLALLATSAGPVASDSIVDALWPDAPPASAGKIVQTYVSRLRKALGQEAIETRGRGYALSLPADAVDADAFRRLAREGRPAEALALWRGPALADVRDLPALALEADRLESERLSVLEQRIDLDLEHGTSPALIGELQALVAQHPLREKPAGQLMLALYRAGRQTEALDVYTQTRQRLADELGLEPGPLLKDMQQQILAHDARLTAAPPPSSRPKEPGETPRHRRRRALPTAIGVVAVLVLVAAAAAWAALVLLDRGTGSVDTGRDTVARIDPETARIVESVSVGRDPGSIAATADYVWVVNDTDGTLSRV